MRGGALVLAAGYSRRFGSDKRWYELATGEPLLTSTLRLYLGCVDETAVILRKDDTLIATHLQQTFKGSKSPNLLFSPNSHMGMGHSIADAMSQLKDWDYVILALGDMPCVQPSTIRSIEQELQSARTADCPKIVRPVYRGPHQGQKAGHPVGFTREFFTELEALGGDRGAKQVIERHASALVLLKCDDDGILWDLDKIPV